MHLNKTPLTNQNSQTKSFFKIHYLCALLKMIYEIQIIREHRA